VVVLVSDGLTEDSARQHNAFGYRFAELIDTAGHRSARRLGEAIVDEWRRHPRDEDWADDVTVVVAMVDSVE
jgi:serine phosphatase RsbU (regulator of sigma subunit)